MPDRRRQYDTASNVRHLTEQDGTEDSRVDDLRVVKDGFDLYGVTPDYRRLFVAHNYVFYLIECVLCESTVRKFQ